MSEQMTDYWPLAAAKAGDAITLQPSNLVVARVEPQGQQRLGLSNDECERPCRWMYVSVRPCRGDRSPTGYN